MSKEGINATFMFQEPLETATGFVEKPVLLHGPTEVPEKFFIEFEKEGSRLDKFLVRVLGKDDEMPRSCTGREIEVISFRIQMSEPSTQNNTQQWTAPPSTWGKDFRAVSISSFSSAGSRTPVPSRPEDRLPVPSSRFELNIDQRSSPGGHLLRTPESSGPRIHQQYQIEEGSPASRDPAGSWVTTTSALSGHTTPLLSAQSGLEAPTHSGFQIEKMSLQTPLLQQLTRNISSYLYSFGGYGAAQNPGEQVAPAAQAAPRVVTFPQGPVQTGDAAAKLFDSSSSGRLGAPLTEI